MAQLILGLGTNIGDRRKHLAAAIAVLSAQFSGLRCSRVYESSALLLPGSPPDWNQPFLNMVVSGTTEDTPQGVLDWLKRAETELGRKDRGRWGPREIDIDILAYDDVVMDAPHLTIPHRGLLARDFALVPLAEVAPSWRYPVPGPHHHKSASEIVRELGLREHAGLTLTDIRLAP